VCVGIEINWWGLPVPQPQFLELNEPFLLFFPNKVAGMIQGFFNGDNFTINLLGHPTKKNDFLIKEETWGACGTNSG
jgi:hypothetical protein